MKIKAQKGFSLAEVLISLTVVSIMLAVAAPVLTKHSVGDNAWQWTEGEQTKNGTSYDGNNIVIGKRTVPTETELSDTDNDTYKYFNSFADNSYLIKSDEIIQNANDSLFVDDDRLISKLSIIKPEKRDYWSAGKGALNDSHISFYNIVNGETEYAGRLSMDQDNLSFGIASLQSFETSDLNSSYNTAIGHYTLSHLVSEKAAGGNVSFGYGAMAKVGSYILSAPSTRESVAVGYKSLANAKYADQDVVIGNHMGDKVEEITSQGNVIIGNYTNPVPVPNRIFQGNNIFIGNNAGRGIPIDKNTKFVSDEVNPKLWSTFAIGNVVPGATDETAVELMQLSNNKKLVVNGDFVIRTADGTRTLFKVDASGQVIDPTNNVNFFEGRTDIFGESSHNGPDRCEGAEICIAKFKVPVINNDSFTGKYQDAYDIYIKGMVNTNEARTSLLGSSLFILDRCKESLDSVLRSFSSLNSLNNGTNFVEKYLGIDVDANGIESFFDSFWGSDARLKNIYGDSTAGLKEINALKIKNYTYKADKIKTPHVGVIAQELQKIFPNSVFEGSDGYLSITQEEMFYGLVNSIQELSKKNDKVSEKIALSKEKVEYTNVQNELIEQENKLLEKQNKEFAKRIAKLQKNK